MAIEKQIWISMLMEGFYPSRTFLSRSVDMTAMVEYNKINLAEAGVDPEVLVDNTTFPVPTATRPDTALELMETLGASLRQSYPSARLVIGFAETATAIGAVAAAQLAGDCFYVQTTREDCPGDQNFLEFQEEHSHAVEQKLCGDALEAGLAATDTVILVDDEISTGKTILNMVEQMAARYPSLREKTVVAASILNRVTPEQEARLRQAGIVCHCLVRLPQADYDSQVARYTVEEAPQPPQWTPEMPFSFRVFAICSCRGRRSVFFRVVYPAISWPRTTRL